MRDLEIRGAGNVLGAEQHGHIAAVGFDTYARLLQESVAELKGEPVAEEKEIRIDLPVRAFVPPGWLEQEALRLDLYRRIGSAGDHELLARVREESIDRFGRLPEEVETLFAVASLRLTCDRLGVEEVSTYRQQVRVKPLDLPEALEVDLAARAPGATYHRSTSTLNVDAGSVAGVDLPAVIERALVRATSEHDDVATMPA